MMDYLRWLQREAAGPEICRFMDEFGLHNPRHAHKLAISPGNTTPSIEQPSQSSEPKDELNGRGSSLHVGLSSPLVKLREVTSSRYAMNCQ
jgi:hypothetical protein